MNEQHEIDNLFREQAGNFRPKVPDDSWSKIASSLKNKKPFWKEQANLFFGLLGVIVLLIILINPFSYDTQLPQFVISNNQLNEITSKVEQSEIESSQKLNSDKDNNDQNKMLKSDITTTENSQSIDNSAVNNETTSSVSTTQKHFKTILQSGKVGNTIKPKTKNSNVAINQPSVDKVFDAEVRSISQVEQNITPKETSAAIKSENTIVSEELSSTVSSETENIVAIESISDSSKTVVSQEIQSLDKPLQMENNPVEKAINAAMLGLSYSVGYAFTYRNAGNFDKDSSIQAETRADDWYHTYQTRFQIDFLINNKLSLGFGIGNGKFGSISDFEVTKDYLKYINVNQFGKSSSGIFTANNIDNLLLATNSPDVNYLKKFDKIRVVFTYLDLPVRVNYTFFQYKKFSTSFTIGGDVMKIQSNLVSLRKENSWYELGNVQNTKTYLFGGNIGTQFIYGIKKSGGFQFFFNPCFSYYFQSVNIDKEFTYKPYIFSMNVGGRILL